MGYAKTVGYTNCGINSIRKNYVYEDSKENFRSIYIEFHSNGSVSFGEVFDGLYHVMINFKKDDMDFIKRNLIMFDEKEFEAFDIKENEVQEE